MTREEAIKELKIEFLGESDRQREAKNMAIKSLEQEPCDDVMAIHTQGLDEGIRCAMCTNSMKSDRGCDGGCIVDDEMHKRVMDTINNHILEQEPKRGHWIYTDNGEEYINTDGAIVYQVMCDKCNKLSYFRKSCGKLVGAERCPNCGCKMESEG